MRKRKLQSYGLLFATALVWWGLDFLTKAWASAADLSKAVLWDGVLVLTLHHNRGIAFGVWFGRWPQIAFSVLILGFLVSMALGPWKKNFPNSFLNQALFGIILGGAAGNLLDRIRFGSVVDFIYLKPFPIFNLADVGITVGLFLLLLLNFNKEKG